MYLYYCLPLILSILVINVYFEKYLHRVQITSWSSAVLFIGLMVNWILKPCDDLICERYYLFNFSYFILIAVGSASFNGIMWTNIISVFQNNIFGFVIAIVFAFASILELLQKIHIDS